jgi:Ankyrin repeats (3 copies)
MAPEFVPFVVLGALILASLVALAVTGVMTVPRKLRRKLWPLPVIAQLATIGLLLATGFCGRSVYQAFVLNEPMAAASCEGRSDEVQSLLDRGASPDSCGIDCTESALQCAVRSGDARMVRLLLERGATPTRRYTGESPLRMARRAGREDIAILLEDAGAKE